MTANGERKPAGAPADGDLGTSVYKGVLIAIGASAIVVPLALVAMPYIEFFNDMAVQPRGNPQGLYGRSAGEDLVVARDPVEGTIPRGYSPYPFEGADLKTAEEAGQTLANPVPPTMRNVRRGHAVFSRFCHTCHGEWGEGDGPVVGPTRFPAPPGLTTDAVAGYPDGRIFHIITKGQNLMPAYAETVVPEDRWAAVHFVRVLRRALGPAEESVR